MREQPTEKQSKLIGALREGVAVVQMVFFKEVKNVLAEAHPDKDHKTLLMLSGAITNELFGTLNPDPTFVDFRQLNRGLIEQEMLGVSEKLAHLCSYITDALRIQTLCDTMEGIEDPAILQAADTFGILIRDRNIPLPSIFMTLVRGLGEEYQLLVAPVQISPEDDQSFIH
jgi:hypothetical protein